MKFENFNNVTVSELIIMLNKMPQNYVVIIGADGSFAHPEDGMTIEDNASTEEVYIEVDF